MADIEFVDFNGLAGFMDLGFVEQGFEMVHRTGTLDFGNHLVEQNRHLVGDNWDTSFGANAEDWRQPEKPVKVVVGLPPCSGWSCWTGPANRGPEAKAHAHTRALMEYAGKAKPEVVVFECVGQAFSQGREVMLKYRDMVEEISGHRYDLHHVKMNNLMVGGLSYRPRYFWVAVQGGMPFSAHAEWPDEVPSLLDTIGDLADLPQTWGKQDYDQTATPSHFVTDRLSKTGQVDGHQGHTNIHERRISETMAWLRKAGADWRWGEGLSTALQRLYEIYGELPPTWETKSEKILSRKFDMGFSLPYRWPGDCWANVLTGGCLDMVIHPTRDRCITHREAARIQGLPDDWVIEPSKNYSPLSDTWGKAVSKDAGKWIAGHVKNTITGKTTLADQMATAERIGENEWMHKTDENFSRSRGRNRYFPGTKGGISRAYNPELWPFGAKQVVEEISLAEEALELEQEPVAAA